MGRQHMHRRHVRQTRANTIDQRLQRLGLHAGGSCAGAPANVGIVG
jgi:hypothetical protein